jgi:predicted amidohydrolase
VISFHECSVTGYTFARNLSREELFEIAEPVPDGKTIRRLIEIAADNSIVVLAGLFERGNDGEFTRHLYV